MFNIKGFSRRLVSYPGCLGIRPVNITFTCHLLLFNGFCHTNESPELPNWFRFPHNGDSLVTDSEDDFTLPVRSALIKDGACRLGSLNAVRSGHQSTEIFYSYVNEISLVLKSRFDSPKAVFKALDGCNAIISVALVDRILKRFSNDWIPALGFFRWVHMQTDFKIAADSYDTMIDILGKSKQFSIMWIVVEDMVRIGGLFSLLTMSKIMRRLAGAGRWMTTIKVFHDIEHFGLSKNTSTMNILLDTLCKERGVEHASNEFLNLRKQIYPDLNTFNIMIHGWCKARKMDEAHRTLEEMRCFGHHPCVISYTTLIQAYCLDRNFRKVDAILNEMHSKGCRPNVVTYTIIMHSLGKAKETQNALNMFEKMKGDGCIPDTSVHNSLIYILAKAGRFKDALAIYEEILKSGNSPNVTTYDTLISAACHYSKEEIALELLQKMEENSCRADLKTYAPLLKMCCKKKRINVLRYLLNDMFRKDIGLDFGAYTLLVIGLSKSGKLEESCMFFNEMILKGMLPWKKTYNALMEGLERKKMRNAGERVQQLMMKAESFKRPSDVLT